MYGWRGKIGLIVPSTNTTMEGDFHRMAPTGVSVHTGRARLPGHEVSPESLAAMAEKVQSAVEDVATCGANAIVYGCTSGSFFQGRAWDRELTSRIESAVGRPFVTTASASIEALRRLEVRRVAVATPYPDEINRRLERYLGEWELEVTALKGLLDSNVLSHATVSPYVLYRLALEVGRSDCDGVFMACTAVQAVEVVEQLERDLGKPVVTANQASFWAVMQRIGLNDKVPGFGSLLRL